LGIQGIARTYELITDPLTAYIGKNNTYNREHADSKIIDMVNCKSLKKSLLAAEDVILVTYYYQTAKAGALYESRDGPAGQPTDNPPNREGLGDLPQTVREFMVLPY